MANFVSTGAFYPMIVLCGLLWPLEGMPQLLRDFALLLPFTVPTISVGWWQSNLLILISPRNNKKNWIISGSKYFVERNVDHKSKCLQWIHCYTVVDCWLFLLMFGWTSQEEIGEILCAYEMRVCVFFCHLHLENRAAHVWAARLKPFKLFPFACRKVNAKCTN